MANSTKTKAARAAARARLLDAERAARERLRLNMEDLALVFSARERAEKVSEWIDAEVEKIKAKAAARREAEDREAGSALQAMRGRGMALKELAAMAGISVAEAQRLMRLADESAGAGVPAADAPAAGDEPASPAAAPAPGVGVSSA